MAISKFIYGGEVKFDLTADTVAPETMLAGTTGHDRAGEPIIGTCTYDSDTQDATVAEAEMLSGKTAYARGAKLTGRMPNNGAVSGIIIAKDEVYTVPQGYHDGSGKVQIDPDEQSKIVPSNIRQGVTILGIEGDMSGTEGAKAQAKSVTPTTSQQVVVPDSDHNYLTQVTVAAIPYKESANAAGGITVTIG